MKARLFGLIAVGVAGIAHGQSSAPPAERVAVGAATAVRESPQQQRGSVLVAGDRELSSAVQAYAGENGLRILQEPGNAQITGLPSATSYSGFEVAGSCSAYVIAFVTDGGTRVWPVLLDSEGKMVSLLLGRDGEIHVAGSGGVEAIGKPRHGRWKTNRRHNQECHPFRRHRH